MFKEYVDMSYLEITFNKIMKGFIFMDYIKINKFISTPLYSQIKESIKDAIKNGILKPNDKLPTEDELCKKYNISRTVVRQAYSELLAEGIIIRYKSKGTFVKEQELNASFFKEIISFEEEMARSGLIAKTKVLELKIIPPDMKINKILNIGNDEECIYLKRLRFCNDTPLVLVDAYLPASKYKGLEKKDLEKNSLYKVLELDYNTYVVKVKRTFEAKIVNNDDADLLNIKRRSAIQFVESIDYDQNNNIVEYSKSRYVGERNKFEVVINRT